MKLHHPSKRCQLPDLIDRLAHQDFCTADYRLRLIAHRCRVSLATAETIIANAGFSNGGVQATRPTLGVIQDQLEDRTLGRFCNGR
jgi:hypothetical protein